jgi:hypothetical protein
LGSLHRPLAAGYPPTTRPTSEQGLSGALPARERRGWASTQASRTAELVVFEDCAHAAIYENVQAFNDRTLAFLQRHSG